jgi:hypothetical protein
VNQKGLSSLTRLRHGAQVALVLLGCAALLFLPNPADADDDYYTPRTTFGDLGILEMPSSRMAPDGELYATIGLLNNSQRYTTGFQVLPWLEGSFRYSRITNVLDLGQFEHVLYDRSFSIKARLSREGDYFPEVSLGIRDLLGTGVYSGEYIVATKRVWDVDFTAGLGWGRLSSNETLPNVFGLIFPSFKQRKGFTGQGGQVNFGQFFHGEYMGVFGGAVWHTPIDQLNLMIEYSSDKYTAEVSGGGFKVRAPVNLGLSYRVYNTITASAGWYYGSSYGLSLTLTMDPTVPLSQEKFGPVVPVPFIRTDQAQIHALTGLIDRTHVPGAFATQPWVSLSVATSADQPLYAAVYSESANVHDAEIVGHTLLIQAILGNSPQQQCEHIARIASGFDAPIDSVAVSDPADASGRVSICTATQPSPIRRLSNETSSNSTPGVEKKIRDDVSGQSISIEAMAVEPDAAWVYYRNDLYANESEAAGRIARVLMVDAPASVEVFHVIAVKHGIPSREIQISRSSLERAIFANASAAELRDALTLAPPNLSNPILDRAASDLYPKVNWSIGPAFQQSFFDPKNPLQVQIYAAANVDLEIARGLDVEARGEANIWDNYDLTQMSNSQLPHVRSDVNLYRRFGINGIANLDLVYRTRLAPEVFAEAKIGYLEDMFAGVGGQILWRPDGSRFSFGADLYQVWQRDFDRLFGVQSYHILTGHASIYYASPWYDLNFAVHAGRYLAGDYGATIEVTRRFSTGVEIGAFATFTNVPAAVFGEGSFDKGIIVRIPFEWVFPFFTQSSYNLTLHSLTRDGGQRLYGDDSLVNDTRSTSFNEIARHLDDITIP